MFLQAVLALLFVPTPAYAADMPPPTHHAMPASSYSVKAEQDTLKKGEEFRGRFTLKDTGGKGVGLEDLKEVHTKKIHALVVDQSLGDYHHVHPEYTGKDGVYEFSFTPASGRDYKVWLDVSPANGAPQLVSFTLHGVEPCPNECVEKSLNDRGEFFANKAVVTFDKPLTAGVQSTGTITLTDTKGAPLTSLEPVMGAYAHIVGFYDDFSTVQHLHPLGDEPKSADAHGASPVKFALTPEKKGFLKYFVQIRVNAQDVFLPMGADVR